MNGTTLLSGVLYEPFGPTSGWTWGNNTNEARAYDQDGNLVTLQSAEAFSYSYDNAFRVTAIADNDNGSLSQSYGYDVLDRLTSATGSTVNESWTYDANGNRLTQGGASASTYAVSSSSNQITGITGALARTYSYAPSGQTLGNGTLTFTYWNSGRLASVTNAGATTSYVYNALGQRVKKSGPAGTELFVYDESGHLLGEYDGAGNLLQETVWMDDIPVATLEPNGSGGVAVFYIHTDQLNTPRRITRPSDNAIVWRWDSDPFGTTLANSNPSGLGAFVYNLRFPGQYYDAASGQMYNYLRDYDPQTGRYSEPDPLGLMGGSFSPYVYASGDSIIYIDPFGLCWVYSQSTGKLTHVDDNGKSTYVATGYAGYGKGLNNPSLQDASNVGPLPQGSYTIGRQQTNHTSHGPLPGSMRLTPNPRNQMFDRAGFLIHGPHSHDKHDSSNGCPVFNRKVRDQIGKSKDDCFKVVQ